MKKVSLWQIFITFFKTGLFTFGGGYAMIAILEEELVAKKNWITSQDMLDMLVIAESTPGVIAVNTATSVGYRLRGVWGAILATLGVVLPSFIIICGLSFVIELVQDNTWYKAAFKGVQACVIVLVLNAFIKMSKNIPRDWFNIVMLLAAFGVATFTNFSAIYLIIIGGALGLCYCLIAEAVTNKKNKKDLPLQDIQSDVDADGEINGDGTQNSVADSQVDADTETDVKINEDIQNKGDDK